MTRDHVREALVSARTRAWLAFVDEPIYRDTLANSYKSAADAVDEYDARTTPAASSDAGAQDKR